MSIDLRATGSVVVALLTLAAAGGEAGAREQAPTPLDRLIGRMTAPLPTPKPGAIRQAEMTIPIDHPRPPQRPEVGRGAGPAAPTVAAPATPSGSVSGSVKDAIKAVRNDDIADAIRRRNGLKDPVARNLVGWLIARENDPAVSTAFIADFTTKAPAWPVDVVIRRRAEQALAREKATPDQIIAAFAGSEPVSPEGAMELARAHVARGNREAAAKLVREAYMNTRMSDGDEQALVSEFGSLLRGSDHKLRMDKLLYAERTVQALRAAKRAGGSNVKLAEVRIAVIKRAKNAGAALDGAPAGVKKDPGYIFSRVQYLRRADRIEEAAKVLLGAPRGGAALVDPDEWWVERRLVSRMLLEAGDAKNAYKIAAAHSAESPEDAVEAEFHAGWYALRFLNDPATAENHFSRILQIASGARSRARGFYWLGRAAEARGNNGAAQKAYESAGHYSTVFYGQVARAKLGSTSVGIPGLPKAGAGGRSRFESNEVVKGIRMLGDSGNISLANTLFRHLAETLPNPEDVVQLAALAEQYGDHRAALQIGIVADKRDIGLETLAFPVNAIPKSARIAGGVERPLVYAIARQESAFDPRAVSGAGARGLLQLLPETAKRTAKNIGVSFSRDKLTADPGYNATIGSAHLGELIGEFNGSYIMTFAGYNAGRGRVKEWMERFGDPRSSRVDEIDWIERIPFTETRNYVQRILENLQVYRARIENRPLGIAKDLKRGG
ncbi:MAG: lytic transglycosylase domain-containing protein [Hyphomicrobiales bacterium]